jgi:hypothetical protein
MLMIKKGIIIINDNSEIPIIFIVVLIIIMTYMLIVASSKHNIDTRFYRSYIEPQINKLEDINHKIDILIDHNRIK